jgi:hypothetical protein
LFLTGAGEIVGVEEEDLTEAFAFFTGTVSFLTGAGVSPFSFT